MKRILSALVLALLSTTHVFAKNAEVVHEPLTVTSSLGFAGSFAAGTGSFRESWTFTLNTAGSLLFTDASGKSRYDLIGPDRSRVRLDQTPLDVPIALSAGTYTLDFSGNAKSDGAVSLAGTISPVPEPESYAMFFAGLGLVAAFARRQRTKNAAGASKAAAGHTLLPDQSI